MDDKVIKAAMDAFEEDNLLRAKELIQGQIKQARDNFIKAKLGLKNDINDQFKEATPGSLYADAKGTSELEPY